MLDLRASIVRWVQTGQSALVWTPARCVQPNTRGKSAKSSHPAAVNRNCLTVLSFKRPCRPKEKRVAVGCHSFVMGPLRKRVGDCRGWIDRWPAPGPAGAGWVLVGASDKGGGVGPSCRTPPPHRTAAAQEILQPSGPAVPRTDAYWEMCHVTDIMWHIWYIWHTPCDLTNATWNTCDVSWHTMWHVMYHTCATFCVIILTWYNSFETCQLTHGTSCDIL